MLNISTIAKLRPIFFKLSKTVGQSDLIEKKMDTDFEIQDDPCCIAFQINFVF